MSKPRIKVVLSGSGLLYPLHAGALECLRERFEIEEIAGVSGGAIVASLAASGMPSDEIKRLVVSTAPGDNMSLIDPSWVPMWSWGLLKGEEFLKLFQRHTAATFGETEIPLKVGTVNIDRGESVIFSTAETPEANLPLAVRASMSVPFAFTPVDIDGDRYVDGGVTAGFPLDIYGSGEDVIGVKIEASPSRKRVNGLLDYGFSVLEALLSAVDRKHVEDAVFARYIKIETEASGANLFMTSKEAEGLYYEGYYQAQQWLTTQ